MTEPTVSHRGLGDLGRLDRGLPEVAEVVVRHPEEQLVGVQVSDHESRPSPLDTKGLDASVRDVLAHRLPLIVLEADEDSAMASPRSGPLANLIENQLEAEQAHLKHPVPGVPVEREAEFLRVEAQ